MVSTYDPSWMRVSDTTGSTRCCATEPYHSIPYTPVE